MVDSVPSRSSHQGERSEPIHDASDEHRPANNGCGVIPDSIRRVLDTVETIEITTTGRSTGRPRRIEIWMHAIAGRYIITGTPGARDWYANLLANPALVVHLPGGIEYQANATPVTDEDFRRTVFNSARTWWYRTQNPVDELVATSPMVELVTATPVEK